MSETAAVQSVPVEDFEQRIVAAGAVVDDVLAKQAKAHRKIELTNKLRDKIELEDGNPQQELRAAQDEAKQVERDLQRAKAELHAVIVREREALNENKNRAWARLNAESVIPFCVRLGELVEALNAFKDAFAGMNVDAIEIPDVAVEFDRQAASFDAVVAKVGGSASVKFGKDPLSEIFRQTLRDRFRRSGLTKILEALAGTHKLRSQLSQKAMIEGLGVSDVPPEPRREF